MLSLPSAKSLSTATTERLFFSMRPLMAFQVLNTVENIRAVLASHRPSFPLGLRDRGPVGHIGRDIAVAHNDNGIVDDGLGLFMIPIMRGGGNG